MILQDLLKHSDCLTESFTLKVRFPDPEQQRRNKLLRRKEAYSSVMLFSISVEGDQCGGPLYVEVNGQGLVVKRDPQRDQIILDEFGHFFVGIRNRIHLLATDSARVVEIQQYGLPFRLGPA